MYEYNATLIKVVDGDTIDLDIDVGFSAHIKTRVRLEGIDTPETYGVKKDSEEYKAGLKAKERVEELLAGQPLKVETSKTGKYGRYIAKVYFPGFAHAMLAEGENTWDCLNDVLVAEGLAESKVY